MPHHGELKFCGMQGSRKDETTEVGLPCPAGRVYFLTQTCRLSKITPPASPGAHQAPSHLDYLGHTP